jgi:1-acyl-sn-glycerol-3-phosphate acyltransferase
MGALAKGEVARYPLIGRPARKLGLAFVDREDAASRALAVVRISNELLRGNPMLLFPEGTTTLGHGLAPLQEGGLRAAYRCGSSVQTLRLSSEDQGYPWVGDDTLLPHLLTIAQAPVTVVRLVAGEVLGPQQFPCEDEWIEAIRQQLLPTP